MNIQFYCLVLLFFRPEYYTRPTIATLDRQVNENHCIVRDFTVGREGYGEVKFLGNTDVYGMNLDEIGMRVAKFERFLIMYFFHLVFYI